MPAHSKRKIDISAPFKKASESFAKLTDLSPRQKFWTTACCIYAAIIATPSAIIYSNSPLDDYNDWKVDKIDTDGEILETHYAEYAPEVNNKATKLRVNDIFTGKPHYYNLEDVQVTPIPEGIEKRVEKPKTKMTL